VRREAQTDGFGEKMFGEKEGKRECWRESCRDQ